MLTLGASLIRWANAAPCSPFNRKRIHHRGDHGCRGAPTRRAAVSLFLEAEPALLERPDPSLDPDEIIDGVLEHSNGVRALARTLRRTSRSSE